MVLESLLRPMVAQPVEQPQQPHPAQSTIAGLRPHPDFKTEPRRGGSNRWWDDQTMLAMRQIGELESNPDLQYCLRHLIGPERDRIHGLVHQPERVRRLLSHFGAIGGLDHGNIAYYMVYRNVFDNAPIHELHSARKITNSNNAGNMVEAWLALDFFAVAASSAQVGCLKSKAWLEKTLRQQKMS